MCVTFTLLLVQIALLFYYVPKVNSTRSFAITVTIVLSVGIFLMVLISVTTCLDIPCCWKCDHRNAKFSRLSNLHKFRLVFLVLYFVIILVYTVVSCYCSNNFSYSSIDESDSGRTKRPAVCESFKHVYLTLSAVIYLTFLGPVAYVFILFVVIYCGCYRNSFNPVRSCKNYAHEIIMIDIFDGNTICRGKQRKSPDNVINYQQIIDDII